MVINSQLLVPRGCPLPCFRIQGLAACLYFAHCVDIKIATLYHMFSILNLGCNKNGIILHPCLLHILICILSYTVLEITVLFDVIRRNSHLLASYIYIYFARVVGVIVWGFFSNCKLVVVRPRKNVQVLRDHIQVDFT